MKQNGFTDKLKETSPVPERISPENIEKKLIAQKRSRISVSRRAVSAAAALAIIVGGGAGYLYKSGYFDKELMRETSSVGQEESSSQKGSLVDSAFDPSVDPGIVTPQPKAKTYELTGLKTMSYDELGEYFEKNYRDTYRYGIPETVNEAQSFDDEATEEADGDATKKTNATNSDENADRKKDYSETYKQEKGVDEADIIKTDGENIFMIDDGFLFAVKADNGDMEEKLIDFTELFGEDYNNFYANEMYLDGETLTVILSSANRRSFSCWADEEKRTLDDMTVSVSTVSVAAFDISDIDNIRNTGRYSIQGNYSDSRMIKGRLYLTTSSGLNYYGTYEKGGKPEFAPVYTVNGQEHYVSSDDIFIPDNVNGWGYTNLSLIDIPDECRPISIKSILSANANIYQTADRLVLFSYYYNYNSDEDYKPQSLLVSFDTENGVLEPMASAILDGTIHDKYSLCYADGVLSVAVTEDKYDSLHYQMKYNNYLYTLDEKLDIIGKSESFGDDEVIKSVTYKDGYAYIVTFMQTDPLFAIDLHDPKNPTIVSELKMPGFSSHMRTYSEGRIIGVGSTADESTGRTTGIKVSMYDNTDPDDLKELDKIEYVSSEEESADKGYMTKTEYNSIHDEKSLLIDSGRKLIAFPLGYWKSDIEKDNDGYYSNNIQKAVCGYAFYTYSDEKGFELLGKFEDEYDYKQMADNGIYASPYTRALYIGDYYYLFNGNGIVCLDESFELTDRADLSKLTEGKDRYRYGGYEVYNDIYEIAE
ncbi:MAG: beta-propeller domain-containing protein [Ruminococcus sp.]|nr:beta-propeller domain-containing protein [Ruminococcus sp.]